MKTIRSVIPALRFIGLAAALTAFAAGCGLLDFGGDIVAVGPAHKAPGLPTGAQPLADAGQPTTNLTPVGEYIPANSNEDVRVVMTSNEVVRWWSVFDDPVLTNLITRACESNRTYRIAVEKLRQARYQRIAAFSALLPQVTGKGNANRIETTGHGTTWTIFGMGDRYHYDDMTAGFDASWEIDIFGGKRREVQASKRDWESQVCTVQDAWVSLAAEIGDAYITLRTLQTRLDVARTNLVIQSDTLDLLESRFKAGIADDLAVNQARYITEQTRATIPNLASAEEVSLNQIALLAGDLPGELHGILTNKPARNWLVPPRRLAELPLNAIRDRPDIRAAERHLAAQVARVGVAQSMLLPRFFLNGSLGLESTSLDKFLTRKSLYGSIGPSVSWPLLQGGNTYAQIKIAESQMDEALLQYQLAVQRAFQEVRNALSAYTQEYLRYKSLAAAVQAAAQAAQLAQDRYKSGISDFNNVLDAQRTLLSCEENLAISEGSISRDLIALYKSLGGGLDRTLLCSH